MKKEFYFSVLGDFILTSILLFKDVMGSSINSKSTSDNSQDVLLSNRTSRKTRKQSQADQKNDYTGN